MPITIAKMGDRLVEVVRVVHTVQFSTDVGWVLICKDFERAKVKQENVKWVPASTRFEWIRTFNFD